MNMSALHLHLACFVNVSPPCLMSSALFTAGHQPAADHILDLRFLVRWFHGSMVICDCSAVQSAVCLAAVPVFLLGAIRHFVLLSCKISLPRRRF